MHCSLNNLSEGKDVTTDDALRDHWNRYKFNYAAHPTTTHFTERAVKISNLCGSFSARDETRVSQYALCYNDVHETNQRAKHNMKSKKEQDGKDLDDKLFKARGKNKFLSALELVHARNLQIEVAVRESDELKNTYQSITETAMYSATSFKTQRQQQAFERAQNEIVKPPNAIERMTGWDVTHLMSSEVPFKEAKKDKWEGGIIAELLARGVNLDDISGKKFSEKKKMLKELVAKEKNEEDLRLVRSFPILSDFDWKGIFEDRD